MPLVNYIKRRLLHYSLQYVQDSLVSIVPKLDLAVGGEKAPLERSVTKKNVYPVIVQKKNKQVKTPFNMQ